MKPRSPKTTIVRGPNGTKRQVPTAAYNAARGPTVAGVYADDRNPAPKGRKA